MVAQATRRAQHWGMPVPRFVELAVIIIPQVGGGFQGVGAVISVFVSLLVVAVDCLKVVIGKSRAIKGIEFDAIASFPPADSPRTENGGR